MKKFAGMFWVVVSYVDLAFFLILGGVAGYIGSWALYLVNGAPATELTTQIASLRSGYIDWVGVFDHGMNFWVALVVWVLGAISAVKYYAMGNAKLKLAAALKKEQSGSRAEVAEWQTPET